MPDRETTMRLFVNPLAAVFGDPRRGEPGEFYTALCDDLASTPDDVLSQAMVTIRRTMKFWPTIAESRGVIDQIMAERAAEAPAQKAPGRWSEEAAIAYIRKREAGGDALAGGWHVALVEFVRDRHRLPNQTESDELHAMSWRVSEKLRAADGALLLPIARSLQTKRERIAVALRGEAA